jgi:hypothetical protein
MTPIDIPEVTPKQASNQQVGDLFQRSGRVPEEVPWSAARKVAFRFAFSYLFIYIFPFPFLLPWSPLAADEAVWDKTIPWFAVHILRLSHPVTPGRVGGDTTFDHMKILFFVLIAALATIVWSALGRKRSTYSKLNGWIRVYVRLTLASALFFYGAAKVIPTQMFPPNLITLTQPFGDVTPYRLLWGFMGSSPWYESLCGVVEMLGGVLLLIPTMTTLGALVSLAAIFQVLALDTSYNVPIKLWAAHLILFAAFLLLPDVPRLVRLFVLNRGAGPGHRPPLFGRRRWNYIAWGIQWTLGIYFFVTSLCASGAYMHRVNSARRESPLYGIWRVEEFVADGQARLPYPTDNLRWQRVVFDYEPDLLDLHQMLATIQGMNGEPSPYVVTINEQGANLDFTRLGW